VPSDRSTRVLNALCSAVANHERLRLLGHCEPVELTDGVVLCERGKDYAHAYFPLTCSISVVTELHGHAPLEMGLIGNEGMLGASLAQGNERAPMRAVVRGSGSALRISAAQCRELLGSSPSLGRVMQHYLYVLMLQLSHACACIRFHEIEPRLARWLLMTHDRAHADRFHLTHQSLADLLGVRRSGITVAAGNLQGRGLIRYRRGEIVVTDRSGLEAASCRCYEVLLDDYAKGMAMPSASVRAAILASQTEPARGSSSPQRA